MTKQDKNKLSTISQCIFDKKGFNILVLDVRGISTMADYFVIAEGNVGRHVQAICHELRDTLWKQEFTLYHCEGIHEGDWVVMDYGEIIIHMFTPEMREKYALEALWSKAKIVDVDITVSDSFDFVKSRDKSPASNVG